MAYIEQEELRQGVSACYSIFHSGLNKWYQYGYYIGQLYVRSAAEAELWSNWIPLKNTIKKL